MDTYIVFGDPRRADKASTFKANIDSSNITVVDDYATIRKSSRTVGGAVLSQQEEIEGGPPSHLSVLLSELLPDDEMMNELVNEGWTITAQAPRAVTVPFSVDATLFLDSATGIHLFHTVLWTHRSLVPTQRYVTHTPGGTSFPTRVLSLEAVPGDRPSLLLYAKLDDVASDSEGTPIGWQPLHGFLPPDDWADLVRISDAVEAEVAYILSTPIVTGVILHNASKLSSSDFVTLIPADVVEETATALVDAGLGHLLV